LPLASRTGFPQVGCSRRRQGSWWAPRSSKPVWGRELPGGFDSRPPPRLTLRSAQTFAGWGSRRRPISRRRRYKHTLGYRPDQAGQRPMSAPVIETVPLTTQGRSPSTLSSRDRSATGPFGPGVRSATCCRFQSAISIFDSVKASRCNLQRTESLSSVRGCGPTQLHDRWYRSNSSCSSSARPRPCPSRNADGTADQIWRTRPSTRTRRRTT
jgi:hypothetical protein